MNRKTDFKKAIIWHIIILVSVLSVGAAILASTGKLYMLENGTPAIKGEFKDTVNEEKLLDFKDTSMLYILSPSIDIRLTITEEKEAKARLYGTFTSFRKDCIPKLIVEKNEDRLAIRAEWPNIVNIGYSGGDLSLEVQIPENFAGGLDMETASADVTFDRLSLRYFKCKTASGNLECKDFLNAGKAWIYTLSGDCTLDFEGDMFSFESLSGNLHAGVIKAKEAIIRIASGKAVLEEAACDLEFSSTSGSLHAQYGFFEHNMRIQTLSGSISIRLPQEAEFKWDFKSSKGKLDLGDFPFARKGTVPVDRKEETEGNNENTIRIRTSSGNAKIFS